MLIDVRRGSLRAKIIAWSFVPTAMMLTAVAVIAVQAFQRMATDLVVDRDRELTRLYAEQVGAVLDAYEARLASVAASADIVSSREAAEDALMGDVGDRLAVFDGGVVVLDALGRTVAARPSDLAAVGEDWSGRDLYRRMVRTASPAVSDLARADDGSAPQVMLSGPVLGTGGELRGALVGMIDLGVVSASPFSAEIAALSVGNRDVVLVDGRGRALYGGDPALVGADLSDRSEVQAVLAGAVGTRRTRDGAGRDVLTSFAPVPDTTWGLMVVEPWATVTTATRRYAQIVLLLFGLGLAMPALVVTVGVRRITDSVNELIDAAQEVAKGHFGRTIEANTGDEIEELARQFNAMSGELAASYRQMELRVEERTRQLAERTDAERRRADQFRVISEVSRRMTSILPVVELLDQIVRLIQQAFGYDHVGIGLVEGDVVVYHSGAGPIWDDDRAAFLPGRMRVGLDGITGWVAGTGEPMLVRDVAEEPRYVHMHGSDTRSEVAVPIIAKGLVIGVLDAQSRRPAAFDVSDVTVMQALANQAGIAIENARLYASARQLAVLEERQRVARDLHDSVTQSLYGVTLYADAASRLLEVGDANGATEYLGQLRQTAKEALAEMRLLIFELRPMELERIGLEGALQARLDAVEGRAGLETSFEADAGPRPPRAVEEALYRIAQEALNNALKHSRASTVRVRLRRGPDAIRLDIDDDGCGFDPEAARVSGGMGLHGMSERAANVNGKIDFDSAPGRGARVRVEVPL